MKLAIIGYGKMGRLIEQLAPEYGFTVHACIDIGDDFSKAKGADVAIEFTMPDAVPGNIEKLAAMKLPVVVGTTGWLAHMEPSAGDGGEKWQCAGVESQLLGGSERVPARGSRGRAAAGG